MYIGMQYSAHFNHRKGNGLGDYSSGWHPTIPRVLVEDSPELVELIEDCLSLRQDKRPNFDEVAMRLSCLEAPCSVYQSNKKVHPTSVMCAPDYLAPRMSGALRLPATGENSGACIDIELPLAPASH